MAVRTPIEQTEELYFITFTCCQRLPLFEITDGYDTVYKWFGYLKSKNHFLEGYVIMPNLKDPADYKRSPAKYYIGGMQRELQPGIKKRSIKLIYLIL
jgi:hypothetical protein